MLSPSQIKQFGTVSLSIDSIQIKPSEFLKILGVVFDRHLTMNSHVNEVSRVCNMNMRNLGKIRQYACKNAIQALVISKIDYCSTLLVNTADYNIRRLQRIQNRVARIITMSSTSTHITPVLQDLHWLPVHLRIHLGKLINSTYIVFHNYVNVPS